jgi:hypothetical protein
MRKRIALVSGFWGQNLGNAFFNIGGEYICKTAFDNADVKFVLDQPGYRTFNDQSKGNPKNDFGLLQYLEVDYIVLQGPMLTTSFKALWYDTFKALAARGVKFIFLSAALFRYTKEEIEVNREFLKEIKPVIFSTRDRPTYDNFKDIIDCSYCGIDSAFFVPDAYTPFKLSHDGYVVVNYDRFPEPQIIEGKENFLRKRNSISFHALGKDFELNFPPLLEKMAHKGKIQSYIGNFLDRRKLADTLSGYSIVRSEHRFNPHITKKIYKRKNAVASDEPWTYFTLYANSKLTISDRVHACVATLAYGNTAILYKHSKRAHLFDRLGVGEIGTNAVSLDMNYLKDEKNNLITFLSSAWKELN